MSLKERPEDYVNQCYTTERQLAIYGHFITPVRGPNQWEKVEDLEPIKPPRLRRPPGKPQKSRNREVDELPVSGKISKKVKLQRCSRCKHKGHNAVSCKGPNVGENPPLNQDFRSGQRTSTPTASASTQQRDQSNAKKRTKTTAAAKKPSASSSNALTASASAQPKKKLPTNPRKKATAPSTKAFLPPRPAASQQPPAPASQQPLAPTSQQPPAPAMQQAPTRFVQSQPILPRREKLPVKRSSGWVRWFGNPSADEGSSLPTQASQLSTASSTKRPRVE